MGLPATFLRLAGCNLKCRYCDTPYTWDSKRYDLAGESRVLTLPQLLEALLETRPSRLVITGGEPLLQQEALVGLLESVPENIAIEIETNATLQAQAPLLARVNQWNLSPKLSSAGLERPQDPKLESLREFRDTGVAYLKFVIANESDLLEADAWVRNLEWPHPRVILMPEARTVTRLMELSPWVAEAALVRGFRFSTRLQLLLWGDKRGR